MAEQEYEHIELERHDSTLVIALNQPKKLNPISKEMRVELIEALAEAAEDPAVRVAILTGRGRAFSSGYDLESIGDWNAEPPTVIGYKEMSSATHRFVDAVWSFPKPLIAAVHGYCLAGACEIAMLCDMTIAGDQTKLGEPEIRFSSASPTLIMPWIVPMKVAKELLYSGDMITSQRAYEIGMVNAVVPEDQVLEHALKKAAKLAKIAPLGLRLTKEGINRTYEIMGLVNAMNYHNQMAAMLDGSYTEELEAFTAVARKDGLRAALDWRDAQFADVE